MYPGTKVNWIDNNKKKTKKTDRIYITSTLSGRASNSSAVRSVDQHYYKDLLKSPL